MSSGKRKGLEPISRLQPLSPEKQTIMDQPQYHERRSLTKDSTYQTNAPIVARRAIGVKGKVTSATTATATGKESDFPNGRCHFWRKKLTNRGRMAWGRWECQEEEDDAPRAGITKLTVRVASTLPLI